MGSIFRLFLIPLWQGGTRYEYIDDVTARYFDEFPPYASADQQQLRITRIHRLTTTPSVSAPTYRSSTASLTGIRTRRPSPTIATTTLSLSDGEGKESSELGSSTVMSIAVKDGSIDGISCYHPYVGIVSCNTQGGVQGKLHPRIPLSLFRDVDGGTSGRPKWRLQSAFFDSPFHALSPSQGIRFAMDKNYASSSEEKTLSSIPIPHEGEDPEGEKWNHDPLPCVPSLISTTTFGELEIEGMPSGRLFSSFGSNDRIQADQPGQCSLSNSALQRRGAKNHRQLVGVRVGPLGVRVIRTLEYNPIDISTSDSILSDSENMTSAGAFQKMLSLTAEAGACFWIKKPGGTSSKDDHEKQAGHTGPADVGAQSARGTDGIRRGGRGGWRIQCGLQCPLKGLSDTLLSATVESSIFRFFVIQTLASSSVVLQPGGSSSGQSNSAEQEKLLSISSLAQHLTMTARHQLPTMGSIGIALIPHVLQFHAASIWQMKKMEECEVSAALSLSPFFHGLRGTVVRIGTNTQRHLAVGITTPIGKWVQLTLGMHREKADGKGMKFGLHLQC